MVRKPAPWSSVYCMPSMRAPVVGALASLLVAAGAAADVVELKDGRRIEGKFKGASSAIVAIDVGGRTVTFEFEEVRALYFGPLEPSPPPPVPSAQPAVPTPVPPPAAASPVPEAPAPGPDARAALDALRGLQGIVAAGVGYRDYASRVIDARAVVQTFVQHPASGDSGLKATMNAAISLYALGAEAWNARLRSTGYESLAANTAAELCPALGKKVMEAREQGVLKPTPLSTGIGVAAGLPQIWACAAERVDESARLMANTTSSR